MPPSQSEIERQLAEIKSDFREFKSDVHEIKQFLIGGNGDDGMFNRMTKVEERQGFFLVCYGWLVAGLLSVSASVVWVGTIVMGLLSDKK